MLWHDCASFLLNWDAAESEPLHGASLLCPQILLPMQSLLIMHMPSPDVSKRLSRMAHGQHQASDSPLHCHTGSAQQAVISHQAGVSKQVPDCKGGGL